MPEVQEEINTAVNASRLTTLSSGTSLRQNETPGLDPFLSRMGFAWDSTFSILLSLIIVCGITINLVVFLTLLKLRCRRSHSTMDYFIMSLAVSDTLVLTTCYPFTLISTIAHKWIFGQTGCVINGFLGFFFSFSDIGILCIMSFVRMLIVKKPYCVLVKKKSCTAALLIGVVIYALVFSLCPMLGWGEYAAEPFGTSCTINWALPDKSYVTTVFVVVLVIPMLIMVYSYFNIIHHMKAIAFKLDKYSLVRRRRNARQKKLIRMTVIMCVAFLLTWTPYAVVSICFAYVPGFQLDPVLSAIPTILAKTSHIINPIVYFATNSTYRTQLHQFCLSKFQLSRFYDPKVTRATTTDNVEKSLKSVSSCATSNQIPDLDTPIPLVPLCLQASDSSPSDNVHKALLLLPQGTRLKETGDILI